MTARIGRSARTAAARAGKGGRLRKARGWRRAGAAARKRPVVRRRRLRRRSVEQAETPSAGSYAEGFREGVFAGGEALLEAHLPADVLIPELSLEEAIAAGVAVLRARGVPLLGAEGVYEEIERSLAEGKPYSLVRLGDGELLTMAQELILPAEAVRQAGAFLPYAGVNVPDLRARDELIAAMARASRVGVPRSRKPHFQPLLFAIWRALGVRPESMPLTISTINYALQNKAASIGL